MKGSLAVRTATVLIALPLFLVLILALPQHHHLAMSVLAVPTALAGGLETESLLRRRGMAPLRLVFSALSATLPAAAWLGAAGWVGERFFGAWFLALVAVALLGAVGARRQEELPGILPATASALLVLVYPGLLLSYIVRLAGLPNATRVLLFFFTLVLLNDIAAYLAGRALGRYTRVNLPVSPNKSGAGFAGGFLVSVAVALVYNRYYPDLLGGIGRAMAIGGLLGALTILGDLAESGLKRSAGVKDSGTLIPGRGGILDSVDSWLLSAVALYYLLLR